MILFCCNPVSVSITNYCSKGNSGSDHFNTDECSIPERYTIATTIRHRWPYHRWANHCGPHRRWPNHRRHHHCWPYYRRHYHCWPYYRRHYQRCHRHWSHHLHPVWQGRGYVLTRPRFRHQHHEHTSWQVSGAAATGEWRTSIRKSGKRSGYN